MSGDARSMGFVGVSTAGSSIQKVFPAWAELLGLDGSRLVGHDLPPGSAPERYREVIRAIRDDDTTAGALVTTHKIDVFRAARDLFDEVDAFAEQCGEISSVSKRGGRLIGHAKDPLTAGLSMEEFLAPTHFADSGGHVLVLGSGGAGTAICWYLARRADRPGRITATALDDAAAGHLRAVLRGVDSAAEVLRTEVVTGAADALLAELPPGSLVVNATGMGKDRPGAPLGAAARYPDDALAWELNYRGELGFLADARAKGVRTVDGWRYFIHGWSQVVAEVFGIDLTPQLLERLAVAAERART